MKNLINIKINNKDIQVEEGTTILDAAMQSGIIIPTLCYLANTNDIASCKLCVCKIEGQDNLVSACNTKVYDGMQVQTDNAEIKQTRTDVLNLILANHKFDCDNCKNNKDCRLEALANEYGIDASKYKQNYLELEDKNVNPFLEYDPSICINCKRCVAACKKVACNGVLDSKKIGTRAFINTPFGQN